MGKLVDQLTDFFDVAGERARLYLPATIDDLRELEQTLSIKLPSVLLDFYLNFSNGIKPNLLGVRNGCSDYDGTYLGHLYYQFINFPPDSISDYFWPAGLLPIVNYGCGSYDCVDTSNEDCEIVAFDPNSYNPDENTPWSCVFTRTSIPFNDWIFTWLDETH